MRPGGIGGVGGSGTNERHRKTKFVGVEGGRRQHDHCRSEYYSGGGG